MANAAREVVVRTGGGVRLKGLYSPLDGRAGGLVILLHGWEGGASSTYMLHTGRFFFLSGFSVFRLNFRDHGDTHHLNEGMFRAVLLDEVFEAVRHAASLAGRLPCFLVGFSLGGNFALRIGKRLAAHPIEGLRHIVAVSPLIDPSSATDAIDNSPLLRAYFLKKWRRSLLRKQRLFPHLYDFSAVMCHKTIRSMTEALLRIYRTGYDAESYFGAYKVGDHDLERLGAPTTIIASLDDPAIPAKDFSGLSLGAEVELIMLRKGGHNGFLEGVFAPTWYEKKALDIFSRYT